MTAREHLDQLDALRAEAQLTGPWELLPEEGIWEHDVEGGIGAFVTTLDDLLPADAALIVAAVNALPQHTAALRAVLDLHQPAHETGPTSCVECNQGRKFVAYPCPTVSAITAALNPAEEQK